jgi:hypothetical protein
MGDGSTQAHPGFAERFRAELAVMARRDGALYALAFCTLIAGFLMQPVTGRHPDWDLFSGVFRKLFTIGGAIGSIILAWQLARVALVERSGSPTLAMGRWIGGHFADGRLAANIVHTLAVFVAFACGFSVLKGAIGVVTPFSWDIAFAELDRAIHFGQAPHEWLQPILDNPRLLFWINFNYHIWFFLKMAAIVACCCALCMPALRHQYLMSFMLVWFVGGFLIASGFASAGPVYFERLGLGGYYASLMAQLHAADAMHPVWALEVQQNLWDGFTGVRDGAAGVSAFPSMHVATATLFVLAARWINPWLFGASIVFWALTVVGSVVLAWHYAVDGYAATLIAIVAWRISGAYARRFKSGALGLDTARA